MSRIGKKPIKLTEKVQVTLNGDLITVKGPKGELKQKLVPEVMVELKADEILVNVKNENKDRERALWGLYRSLINNMVNGVMDGFTKQLEINGIGFKAQTQGNNLILNVGFSHPVNYAIPQGITITVEKNIITVSGLDKQSVGQTAAEIRSIKKPEPYKGKGIKYVNEVIRRKAGKSVKSATG